MLKTLTAKMDNFDPQKLDIWDQKAIFWKRDFCQQGLSPINLGQQFVHWTRPEKIPFLRYRSFSGARAHLPSLVGSTLFLV